MHLTGQNPKHALGKPVKCGHATSRRRCGGLRAGNHGGSATLSSLNRIFILGGKRTRSIDPRKKEREGPCGVGRCCWQRRRSGCTPSQWFSEDQIFGTFGRFPKNLLIPQLTPREQKKLSQLKKEFPGEQNPRELPVGRPPDARSMHRI